MAASSIEQIAKQKAQRFIDYLEVNEVSLDEDYATTLVDVIIEACEDAIAIEDPDMQGQALDFTP